MNPPSRTRRGESWRLDGPSERTIVSESAAFTLMELLVVLAVVAVGAMLLVPALARTQPDSRAARCLNNHRQLCRAWQMYADDNNDKLAVGVAGVSPSQPWLLIPGWLDWTTSPDNTNRVSLTDPRYSRLAHYYGKDARLFKCPADQYVSSVQRSRAWKERVRSVSWNVCLGDSSSAPMFDPAYRFVKKMTDLLNPKASDTWVSLDEHPDSINDAGVYPPATSAWVDVPANYHDGGVSVAFADSHVEMHLWQASLLNVPVKYAFSAPSVTVNDQDLLWLRYRTPRRPGVN